ncbi:putative glutathione transferase [Helianthus annuus]|nr:putative glutathione transferase [Helianthus annuus]
MKNKSADLLKYNPVYKQVPVLVHNGNPIPESLVIVEYIDDVWKGYPILPQDPYEKSVVRFWAKFIDSTVMSMPSVIGL